MYQRSIWHIAYSHAINQYSPAIPSTGTIAFLADTLAIRNKLFAKLFSDQPHRF